MRWYCFFTGGVYFYNSKHWGPVGTSYQKSTLLQLLGSWIQAMNQHGCVMMGIIYYAVKMDYSSKEWVLSSVCLELWPANKMASFTEFVNSCKPVCIKWNFVKYLLCYGYFWCLLSNLSKTKCVEYFFKYQDTVLYCLSVLNV